MLLYAPVRERCGPRGGSPRCFLRLNHTANRSVVVVSQLEGATAERLCLRPRFIVEDSCCHVITVANLTPFCFVMS